MEFKGPRVAKKILEKNKVVFAPPQFQNLLHNNGNQDSVVLARFINTDNNIYWLGCKEIEISYTPGRNVSGTVIWKIV